MQWPICCHVALATRSHWGPQLGEPLRVRLERSATAESASSALSVERALPDGDVGAARGAARGPGSSVWCASAPQELQPPLQAMRVARVLEPASELATHRMLYDDTATTSLGRLPGAMPCADGRSEPVPEQWTPRSARSQEQTLSEVCAGQCQSSSL